MKHTKPYEAKIRIWFFVGITPISRLQPPVFRAKCSADALKDINYESIVIQTGSVYVI